MLFNFRGLSGRVLATVAAIHLLLLTPVHAESETDSVTPVGDRFVATRLGKMLAAGEISADDTCLDEYLTHYHSSLPPAVVASTVGPVIGGGVGFMLLGTIISLASFSASNCRWFVPCTGNIPFLTAGAYGAVALVAVAAIVAGVLAAISGTRHSLLHLLTNAYDGQGRKLTHFTRKLNRKLERYDVQVTSDQVAAQIQSWDRDQSLCNGTISRKRTRLVARKRDLERSLLRTFSEDSVRDDLQDGE